MARLGPQRHREKNIYLTVLLGSWRWDLWAVPKRR